MEKWIKMLQPYFPASAKIEKGQPVTLLTSVLVYLGGALAAWLVLRKLLGWIPVIGWISSRIFSLVLLYCIVGMLLTLFIYYGDEISKRR